jgi:hypothetical protein
MSFRTVLGISFLALVATPLSFGQQSAHDHNHAAHMLQMPAKSAGSNTASVAGAKPMLVVFPEELREHTLSNMRDHLLALAQIQDQLAQQKFDAAADIAEQRLGMSSLALHGAHEVARYMPEGMQAAGTAMHRAASRFALSAQESGATGDVGKSLGALATLTRTCVACHAGYRLR